MLSLREGSTRLRRAGSSQSSAAVTVPVWVVKPSRNTSPVPECASRTS